MDCRPLAVSNFALFSGDGDRAIGEAMSLASVNRPRDARVLTSAGLAKDAIRNSVRATPREFSTVLNRSARLANLQDALAADRLAECRYSNRCAPFSTELAYRSWRQPPLSSAPPRPAPQSSMASFCSP
jgi:hypothetical protein